MEIMCADKALLGYHSYLLALGCILRSQLQGVDVRLVENIKEMIIVVICSISPTADVAGCGWTCTLHFYHKYHRVQNPQMSK